MSQTAIYGEVQNPEGAPLRLIRVTVYREEKELGYQFTEEDGRYRIEIEPESEVTVRFDTHPGFINEKDWHPYVVTRVCASKDIELTAELARVGTGLGTHDLIETLAAYQYCTMWIKEAAEAGSANHRLSQMLHTSPITAAVHELLQRHFQALAE